MCLPFYSIAIAYQRLFMCLPFLQYIICLSKTVHRPSFLKYTISLSQSVHVLTFLQYIICLSKRKKVLSCDQPLELTLFRSPERISSELLSKRSSPCKKQTDHFILHQLIKTDLFTEFLKIKFCKWICDQYCWEEYPPYSRSGVGVVDIVDAILKSVDQCCSVYFFVTAVEVCVCVHVCVCVCACMCACIHISELWDHLQN